jgi:hypothetical protein
VDLSGKDGQNVSGKLNGEDGGDFTLVADSIDFTGSVTSRGGKGGAYVESWWYATYYYGGNGGTVMLLAGRDMTGKPSAYLSGGSSGNVLGGCVYGGDGGNLYIGYGATNQATIWNFSSMGGSNDGLACTYNSGARGGDYLVDKSASTVTTTLSAGAGGTISPSGAFPTPWGSDLTVTITPDAGYRVKDLKMNGGSVGAMESFTIYNIAGNNTIAATFEQKPACTISITKSGLGQGTVVGAAKDADKLIDCGLDCEGTYGDGDPILLSVQADPGSVFAGWSEDACPGTGNRSGYIVTTGNETQTVDARFEPETPGSVKRLRRGWNLVSLSRQPPSTAIEQALASISGKIVIVWGYHNADKAWKKWKPGSADATLLTMEPGKGYRIYMTDADMLNMINWQALQSSAVTLYEGWNLVGYGGTTTGGPVTPLATLAAPSGPLSGDGKAETGV